MKEFEGKISCTYEIEGITAFADTPDKAVELMKKREVSVCPGTIVDIEVDLVEE